VLSFLLLLVIPAFSQIGTRFPSERKVVTDPVTGAKLVFLTSMPFGDHKIYPTHNQWTSDGEWLIFRSGRVAGEAMAVHEETGVMVQVTEGGYTGMLNVARKSMMLYFMRRDENEKGAVHIIEVNLEKLFADSEAGRLKEVDA
jgi:oligogalacturonide lyase